jgi:hypothetical protein
MMGVLAFFARRRDVVLEEQAGDLVDGGEHGQVSSVCACRAEDEPCLFTEARWGSGQLLRFGGGQGAKKPTYVPERKSTIILYHSRQSLRRT